MASLSTLLLWNLERPPFPSHLESDLINSHDPACLRSY